MFEATSSEAAASELLLSDDLMPDTVPPDTASEASCNTPPPAETPRQSNIVGIDGKVFVQPEGPQVSATLVGELERLLDAAKMGDIVGMAGSFIHSDRLVSYSFAGAVGGFGVIGGLECLKERLVRHALTTD